MVFNLFSNVFNSNFWLESNKLTVYWWIRNCTNCGEDRRNVKFLVIVRFGKCDMNFSFRYFPIVPLNFCSKDVAKRFILPYFLFYYVFI